METRRIASPPAGLAPLASARRRGQRPFILPRPERDGDDEEEAPERAEPREGEREAERTEQETTVSRERSDDETGHHIDVRG